MIIFANDGYPRLSVAPVFTFALGFSLVFVEGPDASKSVR